MKPALGQQQCWVISDLLWCRKKVTDGLARWGCKRQLPPFSPGAEGNHGLGHAESRPKAALICRARGKAAPQPWAQGLENRVGHGPPRAMWKYPAFPVRLWLEPSPDTATGKSLGSSSGFAVVEVSGAAVYFCYFMFVAI